MKQATTEKLTNAIIDIACENDKVSWLDIEVLVEGNPQWNPLFNSWDWSSIRSALQRAIDAEMLIRTENRLVEEYELTHI